MARCRKQQGCGGVRSARLLAGCAWACALLAATTTEAHADVDTSTGLGDNTLTNSGKFATVVYLLQHKNWITTLRWNHSSM